jgi:hypothetical protein
MKSFEQIAQAMYGAYFKGMNGTDANGCPLPTWAETSPKQKDAWTEAAKQAAAELALVH